MARRPCAELLPERPRTIACGLGTRPSRRKLAHAALGFAQADRSELVACRAGFPYSGDDPDGFMGKDEVVEHLVGYARSFDAPVREGITVTRVVLQPAGDGFVVHTTEGDFDSRNVVLATGALQRPNVPAFAPEIPAGITQLVASDYRNPQTVPPGKVLIVGSGETGCQIAEELARAGREVLLSCGRSWWPPRRYRGRDIAAWLRLVGWFDRKTDDLPRGVRAGEPNPQLTGADGGHDISAHTLSRDGVRLLGRLLDVQDGCANFADDLATNVRTGDQQAAQFLDRIDALVDDENLDVRPGPTGRPRPRNRYVAGGSFLRRGKHETGAAEGGHRCRRVGNGLQARLRMGRAAVSCSRRVSDTDPRCDSGPRSVCLGLDWLYNAKSGLFAGLGEDAAHVASVINSA